MKLLSICVPTYNRALFLNALLSSLNVNLSRLSDEESAQIEIVITDNASTDDTKSVVRSALDNFNPLVETRYIRHETNLGMVGNWNSFLKESRGKFIIWYPDDDIVIDNNHLKRILSIIKSDMDAEIIFGHHVRGYSMPGELEITKQAEYRYEMPDVVDSKFFINYFWSGFYPNYAAFNRQDMLDVGGFPDSTSLDMELIFKMLLSKPEKLNYYTREPGALWRLHEGSESETFLTDKMRNVTFIDSMQRVYDFAIEKKYSDLEYLRKSLQKMCVEYIFRLVRIKASNIFLIKYAQNKTSFSSFIGIRFCFYYLSRLIRKVGICLKLFKDGRYVQDEHSNLLIKLPWGG